MSLLDFIYKGGKTKRFHTEDTLTHQTVAEHSFGVAWIVHILDPEASKELILAALAHDLAEHKVGDVPSPVKRAHPHIKYAFDSEEAKFLDQHGLDFDLLLSEEERAVLKVADLLDGLMFCVRERRMGNIGIKEVYNNFRNYYIGDGKRLGDLGLELFQTIDKKWREANGSEQ